MFFYTINNYNYNFLKQKKEDFVGTAKIRIMIFSKIFFFFFLCFEVFT